MGCWWLCWWECSALLEIGTGGFCCLCVSVELQRKSKFTDTKCWMIYCPVFFCHIFTYTNNCWPSQTQTTLFLSCLRTFLSSSLAPVLERWDLPVSVFPFNTVIVLYLACTGTSNPYFPNYPAQPPGAPESTNHTQLHVPQVRGWNRMEAKNEELRMTENMREWCEKAKANHLPFMLLKCPVIFLIRFYCIFCHLFLVALSDFCVCHLLVLPF